MTVDPRTSSPDLPVEWTHLSQDAVDAMTQAMREAYLATYRGPHGGAPHSEADSTDTGPMARISTDDVVPAALVAAQERLAHGRAPAETLVAVYGGDDPGGFGPALQIVTEQATMLLDSVTVLLHRLGVAYVALMNPVFQVRRSASGELLDVRPQPADPDLANGFPESWIHVQLARSVNRKALAEAQRLLPMVVADARQVALDSVSLSEVLQNLAHEMDADTGIRFASPDRRDVADLLRWLADGHFVLLGSQLCSVADGKATVDESSRLGVARLRTEVLPELTEPGIFWCWRRPPCRASCAMEPTRTSWWFGRAGRPATSSIASSACSPWRPPVPMCSTSR